MRCQTCGYENYREAAYCRRCGARLEDAGGVQRREGTSREVPAVSGSRHTAQERKE